MRVAGSGGDCVRAERSQNDEAQGWCGNRFYDNGVGGVIGHLGIPGVGKTFLLGHTAARCSRVLVFDTADAWGRGERLNPLPGQWLALDRVADLVEFFRDNRRGPFRVLFKCNVKRTSQQMTFFDICKLVFAVKDIVFVVDEAWEFCDADDIPEDFERLILRGRTPGVSVLWAAQFPATISRRLTGASSEMRIFRLTEETDLNSPALKTKVGKDVRALLPRLPDRHFVQWFPDRPWRVCISDRRGNVQPVDLASFKNSIGVSSEVVPG